MMDHDSDENNDKHEQRDSSDVDDGILALRWHSEHYFLTLSNNDSNIHSHNAGMLKLFRAV